MTIRKHHPKWVDNAVTPKRGKSAPRDSWWAAVAAPDQRDEFILAARVRHAQWGLESVQSFDLRDRMPES